MVTLSNGWRYSDFKVFPKNWKTVKASTKDDWYIYYRMYNEDFPKGRLIIIKGMNKFKNVKDRRVETIALMQDERIKIERKVPSRAGTLSPFTPLPLALKIALTKCKGVPGTLIDMGSVIKGVTLAAENLGLDQHPIYQITRRHIKQILEYQSENNLKWNPESGQKEPYWSASRHNKYRTYLIALFTQLIEMEAIEINPARDIAKMKETVKQRVLLSASEKKKINTFLHANYYNFWRFLQIFYHSGSREIELLNTRISDINIEKQECLYIVKKGPSIREVIRPIKDSVLPLWKELIELSKDSQYLFSDDLIPGDKPIRPEQVTRRWRMHVKQKLGIKAGLYSLKHSNTTETMDELSQMYQYDPSNDVAKMNGHTTTSMLKKVYDVRNVQRQNERLKKVNNKF